MVQLMSIRLRSLVGLQQAHDSLLAKSGHLERLTRRMLPGADAADLDRDPRKR